MTRAYSRLAHLVGLLIATSVLVATAAPPAFGHASVTASLPADGAVLARAPETVEITFGDEVAGPVASLKVYDRDSQRVDTDDASVDPRHPRTVVATLREDLGDGPYLAIWRAVSLDDGHTVIGRFSFSVGDAVQSAEVIAVDVAGGSGGALPTTLRWAALVGTLVAAGAGGLFVFAVRDRDRAAWGSRQRAVRTVIRWSASAVVVASVVQVPVEASVRAGSSIPAALGAVTLGPVLTSTFGLAAVARALALLPFAVGFRTRSRAFVVGLWSVALLTLVVDGHAGGEGVSRAVGLTADLVHVVTGAVWTGGLVALALVLRRVTQHADPAGAAEVVASFSRAATLSVIGAGVAGTTLAWATIDDLGAAPRSTYGLLLLAKVALVVAVLAVGAYNHRVLVPRVLAAPGAVAAMSRLSGTVRVEVVLLLGVLALTAGLAGLPPP